MLARWLGNCLRWLGLAREVSRSGLGKRHRSQTRVNRCCALQDHSFRHIAACPWWSHWGFCSAHAESQGWTPGSCLALYFSSTPSLNEGSTIASLFCLLSGTFPRASICLACLSWCGGWLAADNVLGTAPGCTGCAAGRSVASGTRGFGRTPIRDFTSRDRRALLDNSTRDRTDRPLSLLACYTRHSDTPFRDFTSRNRKALLDNSTRDRTDRPLSLLPCYIRDSLGVTPGLSW